MPAGRPRNPEPRIEFTERGFFWGPAKVECQEIDKEHDTVVRVESKAGVVLFVLVSPTGASIRVWSVRDNEFLKTRGGRHPWRRPARRR